MTYRIEGLAREPFAALFALSDEELSARGARRVVADSPVGYPCRVSLRDAAPGEPLILINHVSHDVAGPFRTAYAIYVREGAAEAPVYRDAVPELLDRRSLSLRGFDAEGMLRHALLIEPGAADSGIRELLARGDIASVHAHSAATGCFLARAERG